MLFFYAQHTDVAGALRKRELFFPFFCDIQQDIQEDTAKTGGGISFGRQPGKQIIIGRSFFRGTKDTVFQTFFDLVDPGKGLGIVIAKAVEKRMKDGRRKDLRAGYSCGKIVGDIQTFQSFFPDRGRGRTSAASASPLHPYNAVL